MDWIPLSGNKKEGENPLFKRVEFLVAFLDYLTSINSTSNTSVE